MNAHDLRFKEKTKKKLKERSEREREREGKLLRCIIMMKAIILRSVELAKKKNENRLYQDAKKNMRFNLFWLRKTDKTVSKCLRTHHENERRQLKTRSNTHLVALSSRQNNLLLTKLQHGMHLACERY